MDENKEEKQPVKTEKKKKENLTDEEKSKKYLPLRIAAFVVAVIAAVGFLTYGIVMIGHKDEGYQTVEPDAVDDTVVYSGNLKFEYYFTGSSSEIKRSMNELRQKYGIAVNRIVKLFDADTEYDDFNNIHTVNTNIGKAVRVNTELYAVLEDAYAKTKENRGYNMFAGALYKEWNSILVLEDPAEYDPLNNKKEAERIKNISEMVNDLNNFELVFDKDAQTVKLVVSGKYKAFSNENELSDAPIIDLNLLYEAYEIKTVSESLGTDGYKNGYFTSSGGLSVSLSENDHDAVYDLLFYNNGAVQSAANAKMTKGSVLSQFRAFAYNDKEYYYYTVEMNGKTYRRNPFLTAGGEFNDVIMSSYVLSDSLSVVDTCYANIVLHAQKTAADVASEAEKLNAAVAYILQNDAKPTLYMNKAAENVLAVNPDLVK